jgi:hypothetical protein
MLTCTESVFQELESYWRRNYKDFFDYACTGYDKKVSDWG